MPDPLKILPETPPSTQAGLFAAVARAFTSV